MKKLIPKNHKSLTAILVFGVSFMFAFGFMLVPLYQLICKKEGINGKSASVATAVPKGMAVDHRRTIKVTFSTSVNGSLPFKFIPLEQAIFIHPGEIKLVYFLAENQAGEGVTVQAIPSITPGDAARFLKKTECFCFTQQYFFKNEKAKMPVYFFIDPDVSPNIKEVTLSYTLFNAAGYVKKEQHFTQGRIDIP